jgi:hypothetical protein
MASEASAPRGSRCARLPAPSARRRLARAGAPGGPRADTVWQWQLGGRMRPNAPDTLRVAVASGRGGKRRGDGTAA